LRPPASRRSADRLDHLALLPASVHPAVPLCRRGGPCARPPLDKRRETSATPALSNCWSRLRVPPSRGAARPSRRCSPIRWFRFSRSPPPAAQR